MDERLSGPKNIPMKLHVNRGHASARQLKRISEGSAGDTRHLLTYAREVSGQCEVCRFFDKAPHVPIVRPPLYP